MALHRTTVKSAGDRAGRKGSSESRGSSPQEPRPSAYLAVVVGVWSRKGEGWSTQSCLQTRLVLKALEMAVQQRRPLGVLHSNR